MQTKSDQGFSPGRNQLLRQPTELVSDASMRTDPITGLLSGDALRKQTDSLLTHTTRTAREVALVSLLVDDLSESAVDADDSHDAVLARIGASLLDVRTERDVVGRVGTSEFIWMCVLARGSDLTRALRRLHGAVDAHLEGFDTAYRLGSTLASGRPVGFDALIVEARNHRDTATPQR